jgi:hypothetical protein
MEINYKLLIQTIDKISSKMYVNWVNIVPITMSTLRDSKIFNNTCSYHENNYDNKFKDNSLLNDEIYDTMVNDLYLSIVDIKWLLFERIENDNYIMFLDILNSIYSVYNFIDKKDNNKWILLSESEKTLFSNNFDNFFNKIQKKESFEGKINDKKITFSSELIESFMFYLMQFLDVKYKFKEDLKKNEGYKELIKNNYLENEVEILEVDINNLNRDNRIIIFCTRYIQSQSAIIRLLLLRIVGCKIRRNNFPICSFIRCLVQKLFCSSSKCDVTLDK